jgi:phenylpropionate dioxygenase-like ring-hydroxylating dioxygenase large terminal subunit
MQTDNPLPYEITRGMNTAPRNAWYVVAGSEEIGERLLTRRVLDIPVVLYRTAAGEPVALLDRCAHRLMPLSLGNRIGDEIQCLYHGVQYAASGKCTKIPTQKTIPEAMCVKRFELVERAPFVWIWMGDEAKMDPATIPDPGRIKSHYSRIFHFCYPIKSDFLLLHENLMDTSHPTFLHAGYFDDGQLTGAPMKLDAHGNIVRLTRNVGVHVPGRGTTAFFNLDPGKPVHQVTITETHAPALNVIVYQFTYPDQPEREMIEFIALAPITPASERECYHFVASFTSWPQKASKEMNDGVAAIIKGDQLALEAIEMRRDDLKRGEAEVHIMADRASLTLRRLICSMAEKERANQQPEKQYA